MAGVRGIEWLIPHAAQAAELDWEAVYREEMPRIYNFFRFRVGDGPGAEDLTSVTFEKAWRARDRYRKDRASVATWLLAIARNVATDHFRKDRREVPHLPKSSLTSPAGLDGSLPPSAGAGGPTGSLWPKSSPARTRLSPPDLNRSS